MDIYLIMKVVGFLALIFLILTFCLGIFRLKIKNRVLFHKIFAILTLIFGAIHGAIVVYLTYLR